MISKISIICSILTAFLLILPDHSSAQSNNYWTRNFNEESSLLSGAVVGGGAGPSAIYYNPAGISDVEAASFSLNASLFSFDFINIKNALGAGIDLQSTKGNIEPRFVSYMIKSKRFQNWSFEMAILNNDNFKTDITHAVDTRIDILAGVPGEERYVAFYQYSNRFRDDWLGAGGSVKLNDRLTAGISMFVTIKSLEYIQSMDIVAYPPEGGVVAAYESSEYLKFNDYRLMWKTGLMYQAERFSLGLCLTTPSWGGIYSDGKRMYRKETQNNVHMPGSNEPVPDYVIVDYAEKNEVQLNYKTPLSIAAGLTYAFRNHNRKLYASMEYFTGIQPFRMVEADEGADIGPDYVSDQVMFSEWLTYAGGARPVFNLAAGYSATLKKDLLIMGGFRTDFNSRKNVDYGQYTDFNKVYSINTDLYHITCGLSWNIKGQDLTTGIQYTVGRRKDQKQIANLSDPVEYNAVENKALQGTRNDNMTFLFNSVSLYLGASFNFGER